MAKPCTGCPKPGDKAYSPGPPPLPSAKNALITIRAGHRVQYIAIPLDKPDDPHAIVWQQIPDGRYISKRLDSAHPQSGIVLEVTCVAVVTTIAPEP